MAKAIKPRTSRYAPQPKNVRKNPSRAANMGDVCQTVRAPNRSIDRRSRSKLKMACLLCGPRDCHLRCILPIMRESAGADPEPGRSAEPPFFDPCLLPRDRLAGTGFCERWFVAGVLEPCSTRMLSDPRFPAALLTREVLPASKPDPTRVFCFCSFF